MVYLDDSPVLQPQPGNQVGVVLFIGEQNQITGPESKTKRHQIDGVAGIQSKDNLLGRSRVDELPDYLARALNATIWVALDTAIDLIGEPVTAALSTARLPATSRAPST